MAEMTGMLGGNDLMMLSSMLDETNLSEETAEKDRVKQLGPGDIGPPKKVPFTRLPSIQLLSTRGRFLAR